jgi:hypothetical protein
VACPEVRHFLLLQAVDESDLIRSDNIRDEPLGLTAEEIIPIDMGLAYFGEMSGVALISQTHQPFAGCVKILEIGGFAFQSPASCGLLPGRLRALRRVLRRTAYGSYASSSGQRSGSNPHLLAD